MKEESTATSQKEIAKVRRTERGREWKRLALAIVGWILLGALLLYLLFAIFVHPINKLKLRLFLGGSYEMQIAGQGMMSYEVIGRIRVDGDLIYMSGTYYETDGNTIYEYKKVDGEWQKEKNDEEALVVGDASGETVDLSVLLNRRNYEKVKGEISTYRIKEGVDIGEYHNVEFRRVGGRSELLLYVPGGIIIITFENIGTTKITPPWEEE